MFFQSADEPVNPCRKTKVNFALVEELNSSTLSEVFEVLISTGYLFLINKFKENKT